MPGLDARIKQAQPLIAIAIAAATTLCAVRLVFDGTLITFATNSDTLLPSAWAQIVWHEGYALKTFQLPRTTSIFPDLSLHTILQLATGSWRQASLIYGWLQLAALVTAAAIIIRRITGTSYALGTSVFTLLLAILFTLDTLAGVHETTHARIVAEIAAHGGAFLLTLFAAIAAFHTATRSGIIAPLLLFALSCAGYLSDQLTVLELHLPVIVALFLLRREIPFQRILLIFLSLMLGAALGEVLFRHIEHQILTNTSGLPWRLILDSTPFVIATWYLPAVSVFCTPLYGARFQNWLTANTHTLPRRFYWIIATTAALSCFGAAAVFVYRDVGGFRYFYTLTWWPVILGAALICAAVSHRRFAALAFAALSLALLLPQISLRSPKLLTWTNPIADCLAQHKQQNGLDAGLATYWQARSIEASSDWALPMEAVTSDAGFYYWGNDRRRYLDHRSRFNFLVLHDLDPQRITRRFGNPSKIFQCPQSAVWVYPAGHLAGRLDH